MPTNFQKCESEQQRKYYVGLKMISTLQCHILYIFLTEIFNHALNSSDFLLTENFT